jgi:hypothetical protein
MTLPCTFWNSWVWTFLPPSCTSYKMNQIDRMVGEASLSLYGFGSAYDNDDQMPQLYPTLYFILKSVLTDDQPYCWGNHINDDPHGVRSNVSSFLFLEPNFYDSHSLMGENWDYHQEISCNEPSISSTRNPASSATPRIAVLSINTILRYLEHDKAERLNY